MCYGGCGPGPASRLAPLRPQVDPYAGNGAKFSGSTTSGDAFVKVKADRSAAPKRSQWPLFACGVVWGSACTGIHGKTRPHATPPAGTRSRTDARARGQAHTRTQWRSGTVGMVSREGAACAAPCISGNERSPTSGRPPSGRPEHRTYGTIFKGHCTATGQKKSPSTGTVEVVEPRVQAPCGCGRVAEAGVESQIVINAPERQWRDDQDQALVYHS